MFSVGTRFLDDGNANKSADSNMMVGWSWNISTESSLTMYLFSTPTTPSAGIKLSKRWENDGTAESGPVRESRHDYRTEPLYPCRR